jgi:hypothetical protein
MSDEIHFFVTHQTWFGLVGIYDLLALGDDCVQEEAD